MTGAWSPGFKQFLADHGQCSKNASLEGPGAPTMVSRIAKKRPRDAKRAVRAAKRCQDTVQEAPRASKRPAGSDSEPILDPPGPQKTPQSAVRYSFVVVFTFSQGRWKNTPPKSVNWSPREANMRIRSAPGGPRSEPRGAKTAPRRARSRPRARQEPVRTRKRSKRVTM